MSDPYIDSVETQIYGRFACEQMEAVCIGLVPALDGAVRFAIKTQEAANADMRAALDRNPAPASRARGQDGAATDPVEDARDVIIRFGKYVESIKGHPVPLTVFFRGEAPHAVARLRLTKLVAAVEHVIEQIEAHKAKIPAHRSWLAEFEPVHERLVALDKASRAAKIESADVRPEVAAARERWLETYASNKALIGGVLRHAGKLHLLPMVFDDLAEVHRTRGVTDEPPTPPTPPPPAPPA